MAKGNSKPKPIAKWHNEMRAALDAQLRIIEAVKPGTAFTKTQSRELDIARRKIVELAEVDYMDTWWLGLTAAPFATVNVEMCEGLSFLGYEEGQPLNLNVICGKDNRVGLAIVHGDNSPYHCLTIAVLSDDDAEALAAVLKVAAKSSRRTQRRRDERAAKREETPNREVE